MKIDNEMLEEVLERRMREPITCDQLGLTSSKIPNTLAYLDNARFLDELLNNSNIVAVLTTKELSERIRGKACLVSEHPQSDYCLLHNHIAKMTCVRKPSVIDKTAQIHPRAFIADFNVEIGASCIIEPNAVIMSDVAIGEHSTVCAGAVIGGDGFEYKRTADGIISYLHYGKVIVRSHVDIGANSCIDKGLTPDSNTVIGDHSKINNLCHIAHCVNIGNEVIIGGQVNISGSSIICDKARVSPNATIRNGITIGEGAHVGMGAVVTKDIPAGEVWIGNPARKLR